MARLDAEMLDQILTTLQEYAEKNLPVAKLLEIELGHDFPEKIMKDLYDPGQIGLHLLTIPEEFGGLGGGAYDIYRVSEAMAAAGNPLPTGGKVFVSVKDEDKRDVIFIAKKLVDLGFEIVERASA